jgi:hypothetical protein
MFLARTRYCGLTIATCSTSSRFATRREINDVEQHPGCAQLDLYVTTGTRSSRELETNVAVFIRDGHVIGATSASQHVDELRASLNFPETAGW